MSTCVPTPGSLTLNMPLFPHLGTGMSYLIKVTPAATASPYHL